MSVLHVGGAERGRAWQAIVERECPGLAFHTDPDRVDPADIRYLVAWTLPEGLVARLPNLEALFSIGAGVDQLDFRELPRQVRIFRMIEPGITDTMRDWVTMAVFFMHRNMPFYIAQQRRGGWSPRETLRAAERSVGIMGLGELGRAGISALRPFGFRPARLEPQRPRHRRRVLLCREGPTGRACLINAARGGHPTTTTCSRRWPVAVSRRRCLT